MTEQTQPINMEAFRQEMRDQDLEELVDELIEAFLTDAPGRWDALEAAVESAEPEGVRAAAHAYKSAAATMRADGLAELLYRTEAAAREGDVAEPAVLLPDIRREHQAVLAQLQEG